MSKSIELYCTYDEDRKEWLVWFPHPLGGMHVLESFTNKDDATNFYEDQLSNADYSESE